MVGGIVAAVVVVAGVVSVAVVFLFVGALYISQRKMIMFSLLFCPILPVGGDFSGMSGVGIGVCCIFWLVGFMAVFVMLSVIVKFLGVIQIWLRSMQVPYMLPFAKLNESVCY